jgi:hypothetical protein
MIKGGSSGRDDPVGTTNGEYSSMIEYSRRSIDFFGTMIKNRRTIRARRRVIRVFLRGFDPKTMIGIVS